MNDSRDKALVPDSLDRRQLIRRAVLLGGGLLAGGGSLLSGCIDQDDRRAAGSESVDRSAMGAGAQNGLKYRGVNYDVGTGYGSEDVRAWHSQSMQRDIRAIRHDLHCNSIGIHGTDIERLMETSAAALENGLQVWLQPRLFDTGTEEMLNHLSDAAGEAERLRKQYPNVHLNVGCEISLLNSGFVPGATVLERIPNFGSIGNDMPRVRRKLNDVLHKACTLSRAKFKGLLTYGAGPWEWPAVDWNQFDFIGLDHYMNEDNQATYAEPLKRFPQRYPGKPIVVLEFGCCTYEGAERAGGMGWDVIDHDSPEPKFKGSYVRSEQVQAEAIGRVLDILEAEKVAGAFVYQFVSPELVHSSNPANDLDIASYGLVKVLKNDEESGAYQWAPKLSFRELARRYQTG